MGLKNAAEAAASIQRNHSLLQRGSEDFAAWVVIQVFIATYLFPKCDPILDVIKKNKKGLQQGPAELQHNWITNWYWISISLIVKKAFIFTNKASANAILKVVIVLFNLL